MNPQRNGNPFTDAHFRAIVQALDYAIITKSLDGIITSWNRGAENVFGYTADEAIGRPISMIIPAEKAAEEVDILAKLRSGHPANLETIRVRKDGRRIPVALRISPVRNEHGEILGAYKHVRDLTQGREAALQAHLEKERLRVTLASIGDGVIVTDVLGIIDYLNPIAEQLTGWSQAEAKRKPLEAVFNIVNEQTRRRAENPSVTVLRDGLICGLANHTVLISRSGQEFAIDDSAAPIKDDSGNVVGMVLVFRDVTARRALEDYQARLSTIVEGSTDAIISKDVSGRITSWNSGAERLFGFNQEQAIGRPITMLIPAERLAEEAAILSSISAGRRVDHYETVRLTKDGRRVNVSLSVSPIFDKEGKVVGASKIARDITDKKKTDQALAEAHAKLRQYAERLEIEVAARTAELQQSLEELETFSLSLSHDLKSPLRAICGNANALREDYASGIPREGLDVLDKMIRACGHLTKFVDDVLSYAQLGSPIKIGRVDLDTLFDNYLRDAAYVHESGAKVKIETPLHPVQAHEPLLTQAIANLVSNGVKFVRPGIRPELRIWTERQGDDVRLWIQDNGKGISPNEHEAIFRLFHRVNGNSAGSSGSGVGLAIVQRAVLRMRGKVGVESQEGQGSNFWIQLPAA